MAVLVLLREVLLPSVVQYIVVQWEESISFISTSDFHIIDNISEAVHALATCILTSLSAEKII